MNSYVNQAYVWFQDPHNWGGFLAVTIFGLLLFWLLRRKDDPSYQERAMARRKEKKEVADEFTAGLHRLLADGKLTAGGVKYWSRKIGKDFGLPDMIPAKDGPKVVLWPNGKWYSYPVVHAVKVKNAVAKRLLAMGVPVAEKLLEMKRRRDTKATLKSVKRVNLPG